MRRLRYMLALSIITALHCAPVQVETAPAPVLYRSINFDIAYVGSAVPRASALERFRRTLSAQRITDAVTFTVRRTATMESNRSWDVPRLVGFEQVARGRSSASRRTENLDVFVAYVYGEFVPPAKPNYRICGYAYDVASIAILADQFARPLQEAALLLHEFGHVIDLPGEDHCPDPACALYEYVRLDGAVYCKSCLARIDALRNQ